MMKNLFLLLVASLLGVAFVTVEAGDEVPVLSPKKSMFTPDATLKYGPDERNTILLYKAAKEDPSPLVLYIHGGGWKNGNGVEDALNGKLDKGLMNYLTRGISVAVVNYRLTQLPDPVYDAARALQFLRYHAKALRIDKERIAATGFSAGGTTSLWLALHDDLADPDSPDPIARESTRLRGAEAPGAQTSIDPVVLRQWGLKEAVNHYMIFKCMGFNSVREMDEKYESRKEMYREFSPITHLDAGDPEIRVYATDLKKQGNWIHHGIFGAEIKKAADQKGAACEAVGITEPLKDRRGYDFIERILKKDDRKK